MGDKENPATSMLNLFGGAVWNGNSTSAIRVPTPAEAQHTVLTALLETPFHKEHTNPLDWFVSLAIHAVTITAIVLAPLLFTRALDSRSLQLTYLLAAPAPPAAPTPPPPATVTTTASRKLASVIPARLTAPSLVPRKVLVVHDAEPAPDISGGVIGGVSGGVTGGVLGSIIGGAAAVPPPVASPTSEAKKKEILRIGGNVKPPRQLYAPPPVYPALARSAHIMGNVIVDAIIDENGNVVNAHALEGPPLLIPEAVRTVKLWKYEPTYLNGVAYPITMTVTVNFSIRY